MKFSVLITSILLGASALAPLQADDVVRQRPGEWTDLVPGGQFKDLFKPMPIMRPLTSDTWGGDNVTPRDISNGIEDPKWSYWCGDPFKDDQGVYHLYSSRWPENHPAGHFGYFDSIVVHAVADHPLGPYVAKETLGVGHNPELLTPTKCKLGKYIIYTTHGVLFASDSPSGPWKRHAYDFHKRERYVFKNYVNFSFAPRDDGSYIAVSRRGYIWASPDGGENWHNTSAESVYPKVEGIFEDPVMWKDDVQYHIIVNDWKGRIAYYLRSIDGFRWKAEPGEAYTPGIARYQDGTKEDWYKYERIRFLHDDHGRPLYAYFAVIDCDKHSDQPNDNHNSKLIGIPMTVPRLMELLNPNPITDSTQQILVKIKAEDDFNPHTDLDLDSLRFGASEEVNYGRGSRVMKTKQDGTDLILTFDGKNSGITAANWAGKLLGKSSDGKLLFGWARLPGANPVVSQLSALSPKFEFTNEGLEAYVEIQNFGEAVSGRSTVELLIGEPASETRIASGSVRQLKPFEKTIVRLLCDQTFAKGKKLTTTVLLQSEGKPTERFSKSVVLPGS
ncbi:hypothetical protein CA13_02550 [Planctomycetes bacterium CA13]|uniref:CARDB domain-containing protein n=1 Tax=Novipirellula herctigrandis TaxID=2527986 RepID=A0A5C5YV26_9BACT|nr:hypothetical protein CA13_02550 [Planctomycetes bacterium CA13]